MSPTDQEIEELRAANRDLRQRMQRLEARMHQLAEEHAAVVDAVSRHAELDAGSAS
jgi:cell division protein FtsB